MRYLFDTNIVPAFLRNQSVAHRVKAILNLTDDNRLFISVVTIGELWSIARQNNWGISKIEKLKAILNEFTITTTNDDNVLQRYADIDAFSQNKLVGRPLGTTARTMGKNDLWLMAGASILGIPLITTDKDFDHLHGQFVDVIWINPAKTT